MSEARQLSLADAAPVGLTPGPPAHRTGSSSSRQPSRARSDTAENESGDLLNLSGQRWTDPQRDRLEEIVLRLSDPDDPTQVDWWEVAAQFGYGRSFDGCRQQWLKMTAKRSQVSQREKARLSAKQSQSRKHQKWTEIEDAELIKLKTLPGVKLDWNEIAKRVGRDAQSCENRWRHRLCEKVERAKKSKRIQETVTISDDSDSDSSAKSPSSSDSQAEVKPKIHKRENTYSSPKVKRDRKRRLSSGPSFVPPVKVKKARQNDPAPVSSARDDGRIAGRKSYPRSDNESSMTTSEKEELRYRHERRVPDLNPDRLKYLNERIDALEFARICQEDGSPVRRR